MMIKDELSKSLAADFSNAVEATYQDLIEQAVAAERDFCAKLCDELQQQWRPAAECADAIRARGNRT
jgi:hypothetical protein